MDYPPPFVVHGTHRLDAGAIERASEDYGRFVAALRDDREPRTGEGFLVAMAAVGIAVGAASVLLVLLAP